MRRAIFWLVVVLLVGLSISAAGQGKRVLYSVDATTTNPAATVVQNGQGVVVVAFTTPSLDAGGTFTFRADLSLRGKHVTFPLTADMESKDQAGISVGFDPPSVTFPDAVTTVSTTVTVTLAAGSYGTKPRVKTTIKARPQDGHGMGKGAGIKVVILKQTASAALTPEEQMLQDVTDALAPDAEEP